MKRALIHDLHASAKQRRDGYLEACLKAGKISQDGQWMIFEDDTHAKIRAEFNPLPFQSDSVAPGQTKTGLGDALHKIAGPIGRVIHWPCMKGDGSNDLKPGSPCAKARELANKIKIAKAT